MLFNLDTLRQWGLAGAEIVDAYRFFPRTVLMAYGWLLWYITDWYMKLESITSPPGCVSVEGVVVKGCKVVLEQPTTQQAALVTIMVGAAALIIGMYNTSGRNWITEGYEPWPIRKRDGKGGQRSVRTIETSATETVHAEPEADSKA